MLRRLDKLGLSQSRKHRKDRRDEPKNAHFALPLILNGLDVVPRVRLLILKDLDLSIGGNDLFPSVGGCVLAI